jgi:hypothetical protein
MLLPARPANALWFKAPETREKQVRATLSGSNGIEPKDELEG